MTTKRSYVFAMLVSGSAPSSRSPTEGTLARVRELLAQDGFHTREAVAHAHEEPSESTSETVSYNAALADANELN
jgi:hypothetical protein